MHAKHRIFQVFTLFFAISLLITVSAPFATRAMRAAAVSYYISPAGNDSNDGRSAGAAFKTIQKAIDLAQPGAVITLAPGIYLQDVRSTHNGSANAPITLAGPADAVVKGGGGARIVEINHDNITLSGFTIDGLWGDPNSIGGYRDKLLYVLGKQPRDGVSGLRVLKMTLMNAGGECVRLRYFAQHNEISGSSITKCGVHDFRFGAGGKNGEGIYIGTAPEQRGDGKNPTAEPDLSNETGFTRTSSTPRATSASISRKPRPAISSRATAAPASVTPIRAASTHAAAAISSAPIRATAMPARACGCSTWPSCYTESASISSS